MKAAKGQQDRRDDGARSLSSFIILIFIHIKLCAQSRINALIVFPITCKKSQLERVETGFIGSLYMWRVDNSLYRKSQGVVMHILCSCVYFWMNTWTQYVHDYTLIMMWQLSFTRCIVVISVLTIRADFVQFEEKRCYKLYGTAEKRTDASRCQSIPSHKT